MIQSQIAFHNNVQLGYFGEKIKPTMIPVDSYYVTRHVNEFIRNTGITASDKILEVGCGMGKFTLPLLKKGFQITGLDLSPFLLQNLLKYNDNRFKVDLICSDILDIPDSYNGQFDYVIGFFTLHHFHHLHTYFQAMSRVLKPGGAIIFTEPNAYNFLYYIQIFSSPTMSWEGDKGVAQMRKSNFKKAANYANLTGLTIKKFGFFPPFVVNTKLGRKLESLIEWFRVFKPFSAFQIVQLDKPGQND